MLKLFIVYFLFYSPAVFAMTQLNLSMEFKPSGDANNTSFKNTTPPSGYCVSNPGYCSPEVTATSIYLPLRMDNRRFENGNDRRKMMYANVDARYKNIVLNLDGVGSSANFKFRIKTVNLKHNFEFANMNIHEVYGGCSQLDRAGNTHFERKTLSYPVNKIECWTGVHGQTSTGNIDNMSITYELVAPDPFQLKTGTYKGFVDYSVGQNMDLDFGAGSSSASIVRVNLVATVKHDFKLNLNAANTAVTLGPKNGWDGYLESGKLPNELTGTFPFSITSFTDYDLSIACQYPVGQGCGIRRTADDEVIPFVVDFTTAGVFHNGAPANKIRISDQAKTFTYKDGLNSREAKSSFDFIIDTANTKKIVQNPGKYSGNVTLNFDAKSL